MNRIFLLSPAHASGRRAAMLLRPEARFELARQMQIGDADLGEAFAFCSGLYFRGKLAYSRKFARPPEGIAGVQVITTNCGLLPADKRIGLREMMAFSAVPIDAGELRFTKPLCESASQLAGIDSCEFVLLGSIATGKYVDCLLPILGERLLFPLGFVGRGDLSRGGLLLRHATSGEELPYVSVAGAIRKGRRPIQLTPPARG